VLFHVLLDGAAGPDVTLDEDPVRDDEIDLGDGLTARVYAVEVHDDGTRVIVASRVE
jgi:hypothetical protein